MLQYIALLRLSPRLTLRNSYFHFLTSSVSDPLPTWLLKANVDILSPFVCQLFNRCLEHGIVPSSFKSGYVMPLLKKADLNAADVKSYRPITNLFVLSKLLERLVAQQLTEYLTENGLHPNYNRRTVPTIRPRLLCSRSWVTFS